MPVVASGIRPLVLAVAALGATSFAQNPTPTPMAAEQHVTVPSLPGEANKEGVVTPDGRLTTGPGGWVENNPRPVSPTPEAARSAPVNPSPSPAPVPSGSQKPVNVVSARGAVRAYTQGQTLTLALARTGRLVTYQLAPGAVVPENLAPGDRVRVEMKVTGAAGEKGRLVDRVVRIAARSGAARGRVPRPRPQ